MYGSLDIPNLAKTAFSRRLISAFGRLVILTWAIFIPQTIYAEKVFEGPSAQESNNIIYYADNLKFNIPNDIVSNVNYSLYFPIGEYSFIRLNEFLFSQNSAGDSEFQEAYEKELRKIHGKTDTIRVTSRSLATQFGRTSYLVTTVSQFRTTPRESFQTVPEHSADVFNSLKKGMSNATDSLSDPLTPINFTLWLKCETGYLIFSHYCPHLPGRPDINLENIEDFIHEKENMLLSWVVRFLQAYKWLGAEQTNDLGFRTKFGIINIEGNDLIPLYNFSLKLDDVSFTAYMNIGTHAYLDCPTSTKSSVGTTIKEHLERSQSLPFIIPREVAGRPGLEMIHMQLDRHESWLRWVDLQTGITLNLPPFIIEMPIIFLHYGYPLDYSAVLAIWNQILNGVEVSF